VGPAVVFDDQRVLDGELVGLRLDKTLPGLDDENPARPLDGLGEIVAGQENDD
jgi:hypothetical protein